MSVAAPKLPGLTAPLDHYFRAPGTYATALSTPVDYRGMDNAGERRIMLDPIPLRELSILQLMNHITDKPTWNKKVFKKRIVARWKEEILAKYHDTVIESMVDWVFEELRVRAEIFEDTGAVTVFDIGVVKSDSAVEEQVREELKAAVASLENVPEAEKDYHPGSDGQVLNLVHPSLFPLVYGQTRAWAGLELSREDCLRHFPTGKPIPIPLEIDSTSKIKTRFGSTGLSKIYSRKFQWLPCEVDVTGWDEKRCTTITSYINNLHPEKHKDLYAVIEKVIACAIPLWGTTLTPLELDELRFTRVLGHRIDTQWVKEKRCHGTYDVPVYDLKLPETKEFPGPERLYNFFNPGWYSRLNMTMSYKGRLQIIVKLANIHLTPEKPEYAGGTWHVEGQMNEHICATALYYYSNHNVTASHLAFRQKFTEPFPGRHDTVQDWLGTVFGVKDQAPAAQELGSVLCSEGRLLTFPNLLQHRVQPFALDDREKPGWRKILALFLVDPAVEVVSTKHVPPQQREWWQGEQGKDGEEGSLSGDFVELREVGAEDQPAEQAGGIGRDNRTDGGLMDMEQAKELRLQLMEERAMYVGTQEDHFKGNRFSLCEH
ncbi:hypothetical protein ACJ72_02377 [Emergomyces africanus]|uniref:Uncharacterized protein n=1 Tax=Emergomyces africanus TaxID=1955775 RepID=A0A1B7P2M3_9EURO|nr:hypothetical protein ACJ72_02377 [Emergomyces africanus]